MKDIAVCICHGFPAVLEQDHKMPFWICEIDDRVCDVKFEEV